MSNGRDPLSRESECRMSELCFFTAIELAALIRRGEVSAREVMTAHLERIARVNPKVNAIVTLVQERAFESAALADEHQAQGRALGVLHGLPVAHKDLQPTRGIRTTFGSPIYADHVPTEDALIVARLRQAGAITIGKTNTPEFGAGSQTFNAVFGATRNPYDPARTCGGSSGGAAVALACGMVPIADGTDLGGSLRNPANFCNVVGLRPSPGRVPSYPAKYGWNTLSVAGPMARTVADCALMLSAIAGPDPRAPLSITEAGAPFADRLDRDFKHTRIAWSPSIQGLLPIEPAVVEAVERAGPVLASLGCRVEQACPDFEGANEAFMSLRGFLFDLQYGELLDAHRDKLKGAVIWNIGEGRRLAASDLARAEQLRSALFRRMNAFFAEYEFLVMPVSQVLPFAIDEEYPRKIGDTAMRNYMDWMRSCYYISATGHPAISVPCGFSSSGLPVGMQIVGRYRDERGVLQLAHAFEQATGHWRRHPNLAALGA
jgi:amidase